MVRVGLWTWLKTKLYDKTEIDEKLNLKADKTYLESNYVTDTELSSALESGLAEKADVEHTHEIIEINGLNNKITAIEGALDSLVGFTAEVYEELPGTGEAGILYLIPLSTEEDEDNIYAEYVWVTSQNKFEELGSTAVKVTVDAELSTTSSNPVQNKVITQSLNLKADSATVSSLSTNVSNLTSTVNGKVDKNGLEDRFTLSIEDSTGDLVLDVSEN